MRRPRLITVSCGLLLVLPCLAIAADKAPPQIRRPALAAPNQLTTPPAAGSELAVRHAKAVARIRRFTLEKTQAAGARTKGSVTDEELGRLMLESHKADLEFEKAVLEHRIAELQYEIDAIMCTRAIRRPLLEN